MTNKIHHPLTLHILIEQSSAPTSSEILRQMPKSISTRIGSTDKYRGSANLNIHTLSCSWGNTHCVTCRNFSSTWTKAYIEIKNCAFSLLGRELYIANPKRLNLWTPVSYWHSKENACLPLLGASPPREETDAVFTFFQIGSGHTVLGPFVLNSKPFQSVQSCAYTQT